MLWYLPFCHFHLISDIWTKKNLHKCFFLNLLPHLSLRAITLLLCYFHFDLFVGANSSIPFANGYVDVWLKIINILNAWYFLYLMIMIFRPGSVQSIYAVTLSLCRFAIFTWPLKGANMLFKTFFQYLPRGRNIFLELEYICFKFTHQPSNIWVHSSNIEEQISEFKVSGRRALSPDPNMTIQVFTLH